MTKLSFHCRGMEVLDITRGRQTDAFNDSVRRLAKLLVSARIPFIAERSPNYAPGQSTFFCSLQLGTHCLEKPGFELKYALAKRQCFNQRDQFGRLFMF